MTEQTPTDFYETATDAATRQALGYRSPASQFAGHGYPTHPSNYDRVHEWVKFGQFVLATALAVALCLCCTIYCLWHFALSPALRLIWPH